MLRVVATCLISAGLIGLLVAAGAVGSDRAEGGERLFIPAMDDSGGNLIYSAVSNRETQKTMPWRSDKPANLATVQRRPSDASVQTGSTAPAEGFDFGLGLGGGWIAALALGGAIAALVALWGVVRLARRGRSGQPRLRPGTPAVLAASLIQTQQRGDEFAEALYRTRMNKTRRAA